MHQKANDVARVESRQGGTMTGKVAIVTGGTRGIGGAISMALYEHGYKVAVEEVVTRMNERLYGKSGRVHLTPPSKKRK